MQRHLLLLLGIQSVRGEGTRDAPLRMSAGEAMGFRAPCTYIPCMSLVS